MSDLLFPLFLPATRPDRLTRARCSGADWVILDLEDAVAPNDKAGARDGIARMGFAGSGAPVCVRVNGFSTQWFDADISLARHLPFGSLLLPKAEDPAKVEQLRAALPAGMELWGLIETARGIGNLRLLAPLFDRLLFGAIDLAADLGIAVSETALTHARAEIVLAARIADRPGPIDAVTPAVRDASLLKAEARHSVAMGFRGKMLIHPDQIIPARTAWLPATETINWAKRVLSAPEGVGVVDGQMIDAPVVARAHRILADAAAVQAAPT
ncbi:CoA ester lyase [Rhodobacteraceae bacterium D3-12]|nr:CoA ester lyase [Rhodobacteraceae bacterium D3-12]